MKKTNLLTTNCLLKQGRRDFEDVTAKAGLLGEHSTQLWRAVGDYDNDGYEDRFICGAGRNALYHNTETGDFHRRDGGFGVFAASRGIRSAWPAVLVRLTTTDGLLDLIVDMYVLGPEDRDLRCAMGSKEFLRSAPLKSVARGSTHNWAIGKFEMSLKSGWPSRPARGWASRLRISITTGGRTCSPRHRTQFPVHHSGQRQVRGRGWNWGRLQTTARTPGSSMGSTPRLRQRRQSGHFYNNLKGQICSFCEIAGNLFTFPYASRIQR